MDEPIEVTLFTENEHTNDSDTEQSDDEQSDEEEPKEPIKKIVINSIQVNILNDCDEIISAFDQLKNGEIEHENFPIICLDIPSGSNRIDILNLVYDNSINYIYTQKAIDLASENNYTNVLQWWLDSGLRIDYQSSITSASRHLSTESLRWWFDSGLKIECNESCLMPYNLNRTSLPSYLKVLSMWLEWHRSDQTTNVLVYSKDLIEYIFDNDHVDVLRFFVENDIQLTVMPEHIDDACLKGSIQILQFWFQHCIEHNIEIELTSTAVFNASMKEQTMILDVLLDYHHNHGLKLSYDSDLVDFICGSGLVDVLDWWGTSGLEFLYTEHSIDFASTNGKIEILDWWFQSDFEIKYTNNAINLASVYGRFDVLNWWLEHQHDLVLKYNKNAIILSQQNKNVLRWWYQSGLDIPDGCDIDWEEVMNERDFTSLYGYDIDELIRLGAEDCI